MSRTITQKILFAASVRREASDIKEIDIWEDIKPGDENFDIKLKGEKREIFREFFDISPEISIDWF